MQGYVHHISYDTHNLDNNIQSLAELYTEYVFINTTENNHIFNITLPPNNVTWASYCNWRYSYCATSFPDASSENEFKNISFTASDYSGL